MNVIKLLAHMKKNPSQYQCGQGRITWVADIPYVMDIVEKEGIEHLIITGGIDTLSSRFEISKLDVPHASFMKLKHMFEQVYREIENIKDNTKLNEDLGDILPKG